MLLNETYYAVSLTTQRVRKKKKPPIFYIKLLCWDNSTTVYYCVCSFNSLVIFFYLFINDGSALGLAACKSRTQRPTLFKYPLKYTSGEISELENRDYYDEGAVIKFLFRYSLVTHFPQQWIMVFVSHSNIKRLFQVGIISILSSKWLIVIRLGLFLN